MILHVNAFFISYIFWIKNGIFEENENESNVKMYFQIHVII